MNGKEENSAGPMPAVMGPTAAGKSELALRLATDFNGEIVGADSMQLYRDIPVGTAQPTTEEQRRIPHHLFGCCSLADKIDVHRYVEMADAAIAGIRDRGRRPVVVGGTGFYLKALFRGLDELPGDPDLRRQLDAEYDSDDRFDELRRRMRQLDPAAERRWRDCRRKLIRALEVKLLSGRSILELQQGRRRLRHPVSGWILDWEPAELRSRIAARTEQMLRNGWIEEAEKVLKAGILASPTAHQALGYDLIGDFLAGKFHYSDLRERIITRTAQLARRQRTWFRHQHPEAERISMPEKYEKIREQVEKALQAK